jgi:hypothetical protein
MVSVREGGVVAKKQLALRNHLWPQADAWTWDRKAHKGFTTIPKTMPLILKIMDEMTKGAPVSSTYMTLWCSTWDNGFIQAVKPDEMAFASGFGGQRGEHTWAGRMRRLQELYFIDIKAGKSGPMTHALIHNPHLVIRWHYENKTPGLMEGSYTALLGRALDVGANDMLPPPPAPPPLTPTPVAPAPPPQPAEVPGASLDPSAEGA